jgi:hypothetical protein
MQLKIRREMTSRERIPDGRIDMKYVIHRLGLIENHLTLDNFGKISLLSDFREDLMRTLDREGGDTYSKAPPYP